MFNISVYEQKSTGLGNLASVSCKIVPRKGDFIEINKREYEVVKITWVADAGDEITFVEMVVKRVPIS